MAFSDTEIKSFITDKYGSLGPGESYSADQAKSIYDDANKYEVTASQLDNAMAGTGAWGSNTARNYFASQTPSFTLNSTPSNTSTVSNNTTLNTSNAGTPAPPKSTPVQPIQTQTSSLTVNSTTPYVAPNTSTMSLNNGATPALQVNSEWANQNFGSTGTSNTGYGVTNWGSLSGGPSLPSLGTTDTTTTPTGVLDTPTVPSTVATVGQEPTPTVPSTVATVGQEPTPIVPSTVAMVGQDTVPSAVAMVGQEPTPTAPPVRPSIWEQYGYDKIYPSAIINPDGTISFPEGFLPAGATLSADGNSFTIPFGRGGIMRFPYKQSPSPYGSQASTGTSSPIANAYNAPYVPPTKELVSVYEEVNKNTRGNNLQNEQRLAERFDYYSNMYYNDPNTFKLMLRRAKDTDQELYQQLLQVQESNNVLANKNQILADKQFQQRLSKLRQMNPQLQSRFLELIKASNPALHILITGAL